MQYHSLGSGRRGFIGGIAAGATALASSRLSHAGVGTSPDLESPPTIGDEWVAKIAGKHKQVFDSVMPSEGWGPAFALNYLDTTEEIDHLTDKDLCAVVVMRHFAMPLLLNDAIWAKYPIGEVIGVVDPETNAPALRNPFYNNVPLRPGLTYERMIAERGVVMVACNLALKVVSAKTAEKIGVTLEQARKEFLNGLFEGVFLAPSGVFAVNRAQEAGCTYCYAG